MTYKPEYLRLYETGELAKRAETLNEMLASCVLCPHECRIDRTKGEKGFCSAPEDAYFSACYPHHGNERVISGFRGSGNVFLTYCNSRCVFCQNHDISQLHVGERVTVETLADMYLKLQKKGCHNLDFVSPAHFLPQIVSALLIAVQRGLHLPIVYNSNGYDSVEILKLLDGIVDIYLPDMKFAEEQVARELTGMKDYPEKNLEAVREMYRQVGLLQLDDEGVAIRGLIVRHLVMPNDICASKKIMQAVASIDPEINVNLMAQYHPAYKAREDSRIDRRIYRSEYMAVVEAAKRVGLNNIWVQNVPLFS